MKRYVTIRTVAYSRTYTAIILYTDLINDCNLVSKMQHPGLLYCIVLYCIMRPYTDGPIGPLSYRHSSGVVRNPHSTLAG